MAGTVNLDTPEQVDSRRAIFARWLWPSRCLVCSAAGERRRDLCAACAAGLPWLAVACRHCALPLAEATGPTHPAICGACLRGAPPVLTEAHAACLYQAPLDRLLPRFKFHRDLAADRRRANLRDAFRVGARTALPAHVVLVDDVMTTGATLHAAATALHRAGVNRVDAWVCARVP